MESVDKKGEEYSEIMIIVRRGLVPARDVKKSRRSVGSFLILK
jgi:hypothetical protein